MNHPQKGGGDLRKFPFRKIAEEKFNPGYETSSREVVPRQREVLGKTREPLQRAES